MEAIRSAPVIVPVTMFQSSESYTSVIENSKRPNDITYMERSVPKHRKLDCDIETLSHTPKSNKRENFRAVFQDISNVLNSPQTYVSSSVDLRETPKKMNKVQQHHEPTTPTANWKMLTSVAASLSYASERSEKSLSRKLHLHENEEDNTEDSLTMESDEFDKRISRKEKSLGLLCYRFLQLYPELPSPSEEVIISLDEVAKHLAVERRRIYDIVNVLESVQMVSKVAKNKYQWFGRKTLLSTLCKLKALAKEENMAEQIQRVKELEFKNSLLFSLPFGVIEDEENQLFNSEVLDESSRSSNCDPRREKSLGIMSQKFLMLFLSSAHKTVNLDLAAKVLNGDMDMGSMESSKYKTKIRRLYDIANILSSLRLIQKVYVTEVRGKKPAFIYIGPDVDNIEIENGETQETAKVNPRHSLLASSLVTEAANEKTRTKALLQRPIQPLPRNGTSLQGKKREKLPRTKSNTLDYGSGKSGKSKKSQTLVRHSSFQEICEVAEMERKKLFTETNSNSPTFFLDGGGDHAPYDSKSETPASSDILQRKFFPKTHDGDQEKPPTLPIMGLVATSDKTASASAVSNLYNPSGQPQKFFIAINPISSKQFKPFFTQPSDTAQQPATKSSAAATQSIVALTHKQCEDILNAINLSSSQVKTIELINLSEAGASANFANVIQGSFSDSKPDQSASIEDGTCIQAHPVYNERVNSEENLSTKTDTSLASSNSSNAPSSQLSEIIEQSRPKNFNFLSVIESMHLPCELKTILPVAQKKNKCNTASLKTATEMPSVGNDLNATNRAFTGSMPIMVTTPYIPTAEGLDNEVSIGNGSSSEIKNIFHPLVTKGPKTTELCNFVWQKTPSKNWAPTPVGSPFLAFPHSSMGLLSPDPQRLLATSSPGHFVSSPSLCYTPQFFPSPQLAVFSPSTNCLFSPVMIAASPTPVLGSDPTKNSSSPQVMDASSPAIASNSQPSERRGVVARKLTMTK